MSNNITLSKNEQGLKVEIDNAIPFDEFLNDMLNGILMCAKDILSHATEDELEEMTGDVYDMINRGAANVLSTLAPTLEPNPDYDPLEIIHEQNKKIAEAYTEAYPDEEE